MRPPQFAAENTFIRAIDRFVSACFNEAAAICGGKPRQARGLDQPGSRFNEAAAICGGKRGAAQSARSHTSSLQ